MIAALPMYDFDDMIAANDRLWGLVRDGLRALGLLAPDKLTRGVDLWDIWQSPDLLLAQTCGAPFRTHLHGRVHLIGTPDYGVEGCPPGYYRSLFLARRTDSRPDLAAFAGATFAYNEGLSQSGWAGPQTHTQGLGLQFAAGPQTGAHRDTARAIAEGQADLGAVDAVTWRHLQRVEPCTDALRVIAATNPTPGLPLITAQGNRAPMIFDAMAKAVADLDDTARRLLGLRGMIAIPAEAYLAVPNPHPPPANP
jgi:ABC-type phosphate/phosphonate transport system substrate-binding protein